ncbi:phospho-sugar mutase [Actinoplanes sp. N902-109]|uniref:phospho-sugar mutase n=1 Tax=Actinoplanes sp. (strain N902-109) TaxID=649831 RepID=UPI00032964CE|nr:phospho-sugar mutase [Actinoplanes sp. N902-109]AGL21009.1 phosphoglucomutase/phosphomannomutase alpha/beta/alpha domain I [Actinoplanes sp. N902-109]
MADPSVRSLAEAWLAEDPDPAGRDEIRALLDGLPDTEAELADRFAGPLTFGTAGLRGRLRAGPNGMNLAVVTRAAAGLVTWLGRQEHGAAGALVIGYDARHGSKEFAERTARVATAAGREALLLPRPLPTPVLAYAVRKLDAVAGVMVTASHNPPQDNGYKVYLGGALGGSAGCGAQIVPPADAGIEAAIQAVGPLSEVPLGEPGTVLGEEIVAGYARSAAAVVAQGPRQLKVAYTPLHGVGGPVLTAAFTEAGFAAPEVVPEQAEADPDFPTVAFPNPEEKGAMDLLLALAEKTGADLAIANDPDADRCAVAIPLAPDGGWKVLRGDELGVLLADHLIRRGVPGTYATTIVSSSQLGALCKARGVPYAESLTGFKWIVRAAEELAFGYEEALGYCVAPDMVRDKDGITAALTVAELAAALKAEGSSIRDRLDEIETELGVHRTDQLSVRVSDLTEIEAMMARIRANPPETLAGAAVTAVEDRAPEADVLTLRTPQGRVVIRPSGTEPKLKAYLEVVEPLAGGKLVNAQFRSGTAMLQLRRDVETALGLAPTP